MHYTSAGGVVPMLCPGCCTLNDIPDWPEHDAADLKILIGCHRCGFTFPVMPGEFKALTLDAMHNHRCQGPEKGDWDAVGKVIIERLGELRQHDPEQLAAFFKAAFEQPDDEPLPSGKQQRLAPAAPQPGGPASPDQKPRRVARRQP